jgi:hypothetical protein
LERAEEEKQTKRALSFDEEKQCRFFKFMLGKGDVFDSLYKTCFPTPKII